MNVSFVQASTSSQFHTAPPRSLVDQTVQARVGTAMKARDGPHHKLRSDCVAAVTPESYAAFGSGGCDSQNATGRCLFRRVSRCATAPSLDEASRTPRMRTAAAGHRCPRKYAGREYRLDRSVDRLSRVPFMHGTAALLATRSVASLGSQPQTESATLRASRFGSGLRQSKARGRRDGVARMIRD
jgi:hypothetical protein